MRGGARIGGPNERAQQQRRPDQPEDPGGDLCQLQKTMLAQQALASGFDPLPELAKFVAHASGPVRLRRCCSCRGMLVFLANSVPARQAAAESGTSPAAAGRLTKLSNIGCETTKLCEPARPTLLSLPSAAPPDPGALSG